MDNGSFNVWGVYSQRFYDNTKGKVTEFSGSLLVKDNFFQGSFSDHDSPSLIFGKFVYDNKLMLFKKEYIPFSRGEFQPTNPAFGFLYTLANCGHYFAGKFSDGDFEDDAHGLAFLRLTPGVTESNYGVDPEIVEQRLKKFGFNEEKLLLTPERLKENESWLKILKHLAEGRSISDADSLVKKLIDELPDFF